KKYLRTFFIHCIRQMTVQAHSFASPRLFSFSGIIQKVLTYFFHTLYSPNDCAGTFIKTKTEGIFLTSDKIPSVFILPNASHSLGSLLVDIF
ncbi:MAG: hypothetical protein ACLRZ9_04530, partial [Eubacterium sp.]